MRGNTSRASWLALLCVLVLAISPSPLQAQSSTPPSTTADQLWQSLLPITQGLPAQFQAFTDSLTGQVELLRTSNDNLHQTNVDLLSSNSSLQASNLSLTSKNADLTLSLSKSQARVGTLESQSAQLQKDLQDSMQSTIRAQADAKALELETGLLKVGCWTFGITAAAGAGYAVGHLVFHWW